KAERELVQVIDSLGNQGRASEILYLFVTKGFDLSLEIWRAAEIALNKAIGILAERGDVSELTGLLENKNLTGRIEKIIKRSLKSADEIRKGISLCGGGTLTRGKIKPPKRIRSERQRSPKQKV
ncbi:hypothetical protein HYT84_05035, partial [Candidatus Micrarchaeota archaeon]|nr:hypothetical protein [Candidatus Micrarchaeota archaeon]